MQRVCNLCRITPANYSSYLKEAATDWLIAHLQDTAAVDDVMQCDVFWSWWSLQAYHRTATWLNQYMSYTTEPDRILNDWMFYHSAPRLTNQSVKDAQILYNGYANINWSVARPKRERTAYVTANGLLTYNPN